MRREETDLVAEQFAQVRSPFCTKLRDSVTPDACVYPRVCKPNKKRVDIRAEQRNKSRDEPNTRSDYKSKIKMLQTSNVILPRFDFGFQSGSGHTQLHLNVASLFALVESLPNDAQWLVVGRVSFAHYRQNIAQISDVMRLVRRIHIVTLAMSTKVHREKVSGCARHSRLYLIIQEIIDT